MAGHIPRWFTCLKTVTQPSSNQAQCRLTLLNKVREFDNDWRVASLIAMTSVMQTSRHRDYSARQVYEAEHGVCQLCQFDAEAFYKRLR